MPKKAALFYDYPIGDGEVFGQGRRDRIAALTDLYPEVVHAGNFDRHAPRLGELEVIFATWGMPELTDAQLARLPKLEAVFHAAGNVKAFAKPLVDLWSLANVVISPHIGGTTGDEVIRLADCARSSSAGSKACRSATR